MITEWILLIGSDFGDWILSILPGIPVIDGYIGGAAALGGLVGSLSVWVNFPAVALLVGQVLVVYLATFVVRIIRAILGHVPFIGGNG